MKSMQYVTTQLRVIGVVIFSLVLVPTSWLTAQVGINTDNSDPDPSAMLDIQAPDKGMLIPRMTASERDLIPEPATGLLVYVSTGVRAG